MWDWSDKVAHKIIEKTFSDSMLYFWVAFFPFVFRKFRTWILIKIKDLFVIKEEFPGKKIHEQNTKINNKLVELMVKLDAKRVYVIQFHNGSKFSNNKPIWRFSCTHEICQKGVSYEIHRMQNKLASTSWDIIGAVYNIDNVNGVTKIIGDKCKKLGIEVKPPRGCYEYNIEKMQESMGKHLMINRGSNFTVQSALFDTTDKSIIGLLGVDFGEKTYIGKTCELCDAASAISFLLDK